MFELFGLYFLISSFDELRRQIFFDLGRIAIRRRNANVQIDSDEEKLEEQHDNLVEKENELYKTLNEKYGDGTIEPTTGEFIPSTEEKK